MANWAHGGGCSHDASVRIEGTTARAWNGCCAPALDRPLRSSACVKSTPNTWSMREHQAEFRRALIEAPPGSSWAQLSRHVCALFDWCKPNGELKDMTCRVAMLRRQADGLLTLLAARRPLLANPSICHARHRSTALAHSAGASTAAALYAPGRRFGELASVERIHRPLPLSRPHAHGGQSVPIVRLRRRDPLVALLSFGASAWKLAAREQFIGWHDHQRQRNLQLVVNNARFLILPRIQCKGLAAKILSLMQRQLPIDWLALRLPPRAARNLRRDAPPSRHLLPGRQLDQRPSNRRVRQEVPHQQVDPPDQGYLALSPSPILPITPLPLTPSPTPLPHYGMAEYLRNSRLTPLDGGSYTPSFPVRFPLLRWVQSVERHRWLNPLPPQAGTTAAP